MRAPRFAVQVPIEVSLDPAEDWVSARIVNLSQSGALLELPSVLEVGHWVWIRSDEARSEQRTTIAGGVVVRTEPGTPSYVGIRLMD